MHNTNQPKHHSLHQPYVKLTEQLKRSKFGKWTSVFLIYCFRWRPYKIASAPWDAMALCIEDRAHCSNLMIVLLVPSCWYLETEDDRNQNHMKFETWNVTCDILSPFVYRLVIQKCDEKNDLFCYWFVIQLTNNNDSTKNLHGVGGFNIFKISLLNSTFFFLHASQISH